jgi:hypothetical protein
MKAPGRRWTHRWIIAFGWWTVDGFTTATNDHRMGQSGASITWEQAFRAALTSAWSWVPLTVLVLWLAERYPLDRDGWRRHAAIHAVGAGGVLVVRALLVVALNGWAGWYRELPPFHEIMATGVRNNLLLYTYCGRGATGWATCT